MRRYIGNEWCGNKKNYETNMQKANDVHLLAFFSFHSIFIPVRQFQFDFGNIEKLMKKWKGFV